MQNAAPPRFTAVVLLSTLISLVLCSESRAVASILTSFGVPVTENFDSLANSGTSSNMPPGWSFSEAGANANGTYTAGTGSSPAGDTYSFGASGSTDRALGTVLIGTLNSTIGAMFTNGTGATITDLDIAYTGEHWRRGDARTASPVDSRDRLDFQFGEAATGLTTGTFVDVNALDMLSAPGPTANGSLLFSAFRSATISGLSIPDGASFWVRWLDFNATNSDDGLAVDDFSITARGLAVSSAIVESAPEPSMILVWTAVWSTAALSWRWCKQQFDA